VAAAAEVLAISAAAPAGGCAGRLGEVGGAAAGGPHV